MIAGSIARLAVQKIPLFFNLRNRVLFLGGQQELVADPDQRLASQEAPVVIGIGKLRRRMDAAPSCLQAGLNVLDLLGV